jgi:DNA repair protein RecN (Recombination protein N)
MLAELHIENFAIIQNLDLMLKPGMMIFTGETGAGKSIILDAILAVVGGKADTTSIRSGADRASVEAIFTYPPVTREAVRELLIREDLADDDNTITLSREIKREGRGGARINGHSVSLNLLRDIGAFLVDIHGQSEHLSLLNTRQHIHLLDRYANDSDLLSTYRQTYGQLQSVRKELDELQKAEQDALRRTDLLNFQVKEIEAAKLRAGEEEELKQEHSRLANAENLAGFAQQAIDLLDESHPEAASASDQLGQVIQAIQSLSRIDASQAGLAEQAQSLAEMTADISRALHDYQDRIEFNPKRLEQVEERLEILRTLQKKYGGDIPAVLAFSEQARQQLDLITHAGERIEELQKMESELSHILAGQASALSMARHAAADTLSQAVETELADLSMTGARFSVDMELRPSEKGIEIDGRTVLIDDMGMDQVEFLIAPNLGEGLKPLVKIASGGETSRLMLALKNVLAKADAIPTLIFDEIDQGIGGRVGMIVGEKLWRLGRIHQVFCVTHLPQLAAFGDQHFRVRKQVAEGRTITLVDLLKEPERLEELAQMLGSLTDANRIAAQETLGMARQRAADLIESQPRM